MLTVKTTVPEMIGNYRIIDVIAYGGFTEIYLGHHKDVSPSWKNLVTIKKSKKHHRDEVREHFRNEVKILALLDGVYAPKFVEWDQDNEEYIVMEYLIGKSLDRMGRLNRAEILDLTLELLDAIDYIHSHRIVHRDFKPGNILIGNKVTFIDFSIAAEIIKERYAIPTGTPLYSPPEVYKGSCNPEIDIYGLGATMYFMLTGKDPVSIEGLINSSLYNLMFYVITRENPLKLGLEEFRISNDLFSNLMCECLNIDPMTRPSTNEIRSIVQSLERRPRIFVQGKTHFLLKDRVIIGESPNCTIAINDPWQCVEDIHAIVQKIGPSWYILDNNSRNGLFVKRVNRFVRVEEAPLYDGAYIALGYSDRKGSHISLRFRT